MFNLYSHVCTDIYNLLKRRKLQLLPEYLDFKKRQVFKVSKGEATPLRASQVVLQTLLKENETIGQDAWSLYYEYIWHTGGRHVVFIDSDEPISFIADHTKPNALQDLQLPFRVFNLALPKGFKINGQEIKGCLIAYGSIIQFENELGEFIANCTGANLNINSLITERYPENKHLRIAFRVEMNEAVDGTQFLTLPYEEFGNLFSTNDGAKLLRHLDEDKHYPIDESHEDLDDDEFQNQAVLAKLILGLISIISSSPELLKDGLPPSKSEWAVFKAVGKALSNTKKHTLIIK